MAKLDPIAEFREDHRKIRDGLTELTAALQAKDVEKARRVLGKLDELVGPHFRFEEEAFYPTLRTFSGKYVDDLLKEHDKAIDMVRSCADLLKKPNPSYEETYEAAHSAQSLQAYVSNCDVLAILGERLEPKELKKLGKNLAAVRKEGVSLLRWAESIRIPRGTQGIIVGNFPRSEPISQDCRGQKTFKSPFTTKVVSSTEK
ncbi:MAG: hemerythrin domain-containing protein [Deltaproteobacteria bacterium]|nr:hemerythrin domain-containing protein [Deltaproteobacteria bacterium]